MRLSDAELRDLFTRLRQRCPKCGGSVPRWWSGHFCPLCAGHPPQEVERTNQLLRRGGYFHGRPS